VGEKRKERSTEHYVDEAPESTVFVGVGCLDNYPCGLGVPVFESLPLEGYVYVDSVSLELSTTSLNQVLQDNLTTQSIVLYVWGENQSITCAVI